MIDLLLSGCVLLLLVFDLLVHAFTLLTQWNPSEKLIGHFVNSSQEEEYLLFLLLLFLVSFLIFYSYKPAQRLDCSLLLLLFCSYILLLLLLLLVIITLRHFQSIIRFYLLEFYFIVSKYINPYLNSTQKDSPIWHRHGHYKLHLLC